MRVHMLHASTTRHRPPFLWEDICNTSPQSIHFFIAYAIRLSFIVCFILASHAFCLRIYVLRASYHISSKLQSLSCTLRLIVPLIHQLFAKQCLLYLQAYTIINLTNPATEQIKLKHIAFSLITLILFLFELIPNYFGNENLNLYK